MLKDKQKSAKTLPQRLAGLNKGRSAWGENLACGVAWQSVLLGRNGAWQGVVNLATHNTANSAWQVLVGKTAHGYTANSAWQAWRKWCLQAKQSVATLQIQHRENVAVFVGRSGQSKNGAVFGWGTSLSLSLSLPALFGKPLG